MSTNPDREQCFLHTGRIGTWFRVSDDTWWCGFCHARMGTLPLALHQLPEFLVPRIGNISCGTLEHLQERFLNADGCCPRCCRGCTSVAELLLEDHLDTWVKQHDDPTQFSWWLGQHGRVSRTFLAVAWRRADYLGCHPTDS